MPDDRYSLRGSAALLINRSLAMNFVRVLKAFAACAMSSAALSASAAVLVFDDLPIIQHQYELQGISDVYTDIFSKGYRLVYAPALGEPYPTGVYAVGPKWRFNGKSVAATINSCLGSLTITADDNNPFTVTSMDLATLNGDPSASVTFVGTTGDGQSVTHSVQIGPAPGWARHAFPDSFRNLQSLVWLQGDCIENKPHMFDNVFLSR